MSNSTRLYLTGPMTGLPEFNFPAFHAAATELRAGGFEVENLAEGFDGDTGLAWETYLKRDLIVMLACDGLAMLPDCDRSRGATLELYVARALSMPCLPVEDWLFPGS